MMETEQLAGGEKMLRVLDTGGVKGIAVVPRLQGHHDFFERGVPRAFADTVDGAFDLTRPGLHARASELATARPRSSWQWTLTMAVSPRAFTTRPMISAYLRRGVE